MRPQFESTLQLVHSVAAKPRLTFLPMIAQLSALTGLPGWPLGRFLHIHGDADVGKTSLALQIVADMQSAGAMCVYIDADHTLHPRWASKLGVRLDQWVHIGMSDIGVVGSFIRANSHLADLVVLDTGSALMFAQEDQRAHSTLGGHWALGISRVDPSQRASAFASVYQRLVPVISRTRTSFVIVSQTRALVNSQRGVSSELLQPAAPRMLQFVAALEFRLRRIQKNIETATHTTAIDVIINKLGPPGRSGQMVITPQGVTIGDQIGSIPTPI
jgi:recombination protein RecA